MIPACKAAHRLQFCPLLEQTGNDRRAVHTLPDELAWPLFPFSTRAGRVATTAIRVWPPVSAPPARTRRYKGRLCHPHLVRPINMAMTKTTREVRHFHDQPRPEKSQGRRVETGEDLQHHAVNCGRGPADSMASRRRKETGDRKPFSTQYAPWPTGRQSRAPLIAG